MEFRSYLKFSWQYGVQSSPWDTWMTYLIFFGRNIYTVTCIQYPRKVQVNKCLVASDHRDPAQGKPRTNRKWATTKNVQHMITVVGRRREDSWKPYHRCITAPLQTYLTTVVIFWGPGGVCPHFLRLCWWQHRRGPAWVWNQNSGDFFPEGLACSLLLYFVWL